MATISQRKSIPKPAKRVQGPRVDRSERSAPNFPKLERHEASPESGFADRLRGLMESRGLSARELSRLTARVDVEGKGLSSTILLRYQRGAMPGLRELRIVSEALDVSPLFLMLGSVSSQAASERVDDPSVHRSIFRLSGLRSPLSVGVVIEHLPAPERDALLIIIEATARRVMKAEVLHDLVRIGDFALPALAQALGHAIDPQHIDFAFDRASVEELSRWLKDRLSGAVRVWPSIHSERPT